MRTPEVHSSRAAKVRLRCATYTRKSSEEGLEQAFNSLDAQSEACGAYNEGWVALKQVYDDGGFSGGTMERPALTRLLADVAEGKIDVVVVYKVDRLTRSLSDFAKIVDIFDKRQVSFVSVTQAFNTTSSMGRLTLNVLLSFAQFEREVTGERIRDKIAASKRKGMWMGGQPALGYDVRNRKLVVNEGEAATVGRIFRRCSELKSVRALKAELDVAGLVSKQRRAADGSPYGGKPFSRGALYLMLSNKVYRGETVHRGAVFPGEHPAIIEAVLWTEVQEILTANRIEHGSGTTAKEPSLLTGFLFDAQGERLTPTHAVKKGTRYRYYVSHSLITASAGEQRAMGKGQRIPAATLEGLVKEQITDFLADASAILRAARELPITESRHDRILHAAAALAKTVTQLGHEELRPLLLALVSRIQVQAEQIDVTLDTAGLMHWLMGGGEAPGDAEIAAPPNGGNKRTVVLTIRARLKRVGMEMRFVAESESNGQVPDPNLIQVMGRAHGIRDRLLSNTSLTVEELARDEELVPSYVTRLLRLTFLAPDIIGGMVTGRHPPDLTTRKLMSDTRLPLDWSEQRARLGFA